jgi:hypothetical protein
MSCSAAWQRDQNAEPLRSSAWVKILPCGAIAAKVLELTVAPAGGTSVLLRLTNTGTTPVRIRTRLSWPSDLSVAFVDAEKKRGSRRAVSMKGGLMVSTGDPDPAPIVVGLAWAGDEYERPGPLGASDFGVLPVGGMVSRTLDLAKLIDGAIPAGRYEVRASWRSTTDGRHLGLEPALVGVVNSQPLVLRIE